MIIVALASLALVASACGIPTSERASTVPERRVPFHLLAPTAPTTTTTPLPAAAFVSQPIALVADERVVMVRRDVAVPAGLSDVIRALIAGPTAEEVARGLSTAIPPAVRLLDLTTEGQRVTLDLSREFGRITGASEVDAVAQLVRTATSQAGVSQVSFAIEGSPIAVPTPDGATTTQPVSAADYASISGR